MAQTSLILKSLKNCLKQRRLTYVDVATTLELSEASVKRMFSEENISLQRLDKICSLLNMEISDLTRITEQMQNQITELTEQQEADFIQQPKLLFVAYMLLNDVNYELIKAKYNISEHEGIQLLAKLDKIRFIDLLSGNKIKLLTSRNFRWRKNGNIEKLFNEHIRKEFFQSRFSKENECMQFGSSIVSSSTIKTMHSKIEKLIAEFNELAQQDATLPFEDKVGCSLVGAIRPWEFSLFAKYRR